MSTGVRMCMSRGFASAHECVGLCECTREVLDFVLCVLCFVCVCVCFTCVCVCVFASALCTRMFLPMYCASECVAVCVHVCVAALLCAHVQEVHERCVGVQLCGFPHKV